MTLSSPKTTILVAEDSDEDFDVIQDVFGDKDVTLIRRLSGQDALGCLRAAYADAGGAGEGRPQLLILDLNLPGMGGMATLQQIKQDPQLCAVPVLVLSSSTSKREISSCYDLGANGYVLKSTNWQKFVEVLNAVKVFWLHTALLPAVAHEQA